MESKSEQDIESLVTLLHENNLLFIEDDISYLMDSDNYLVLEIVLSTLEDPILNNRLLEMSLNTWNEDLIKTLSSVLDFKDSDSTDVSMYIETIACSENWEYYNDVFSSIKLDENHKKIIEDNNGDMFEFLFNNSDIDMENS